MPAGSDVLPSVVGPTASGGPIVDQWLQNLRDRTEYAVENGGGGSYPGSGTGYDEDADSGKGVIYDGAGRVPGLGFYGTSSVVSPKSVTVDMDRITYVDDNGDSTEIICLSAAGGRSYTHNEDEAGALNYATREWCQAGFLTDSVFAVRRAAMLGTARYPSVHWMPLNISGTTSGGTEASSFHPNLSIAAATAGQTRLYINVGSTGPVWPGLLGVPDFDRKCVVNAVWVTQLSAHVDSRISIHFTQTGVTTHTSHDRSVEGISVIFRGGASAGTVEIQCHDGSAFSNSVAAVFPINDTTGYSWTLEHEPGVAVRLYKNGVLQCTATANLPSGTTAGSSNQGMVVIAGNVVGGTGNATNFRLCDMQFAELK